MPKVFQLPFTGLLIVCWCLAWPSRSTAQVPVNSEPSPLEAEVVLEGHALRGLRPGVVGELLTGSSGGQIGLEVLATPTQSAPETAEVLLFVEIDGANLLATNRARTPRLELYSYAVDPTGRIRAHVAQVFVLDTTTLGEAVWQSGLKFFGRLDLPPGTYELRTLVRNYQSGAQGLDITALEVPQWVTGRPALLPPLFPGPRTRDSWLPVNGWGRVDPATSRTYPFAVTPSIAVNPAALPVLVAGLKTQVYLFGHDLPDERLRGSFRVAAGPAGREKVIATEDLEIVTRGSASDSGLEYLLAELTPPVLEPGRFLFELSFDDSVSGPLASPAIPVLLVEGDARQKDLLWCDLRHLIGQPRTAEVPELSPVPQAETVREEGRRPARVSRKLKKEYLQALTLLHQDPPEAARMALFELESSALEGGVLKRLTRLRTAELDTARELAQSNPEVLLPILQLHADSHELYRGRRLYSLTFHSRAMVELLAELYAELGGSADTTAQVMASIAGYLQESNLSASSRRLYQRGLQHDPDAPAALLGLAVSYEKYGAYGDAVELLEQLGVAYPTLQEGRLRLAMNLQRVGRRARASEVLQSIVDLGIDTWPVVVACEEMAREHLEAGRSDLAADLLQQAIEVAQDRQGLRLLLAHVYDRQGRPRLALEQLQQVAAMPGADRASERLQYDSWPLAALEEARREIAVKAEAAATELAMLLDSPSKVK